MSKMELGAEPPHVNDVKAASTRLTTEEQELLSSLSIIEKLLVAQAVHQSGTEDMAKVSKILREHALLRKYGMAKRFSNSENTARVFFVLAKDFNLNSTSYTALSSELLELAKKHYAERVAELKELMAEEQDRFRTVYTDIEDINLRNGATKNPK